jgi:hypothetical protein
MFFFIPLATCKIDTDCIHEVDQSLPTSAEVEKAWCATPIAQIRLRSTFSINYVLEDTV